ncbi:MAG TPA: hypothetical protein VJ044_00105 [Candidatus Hodarchaeales archaeon]|nr:hypothetical protein [Candidatus Hodarchaeales archaeon]
MLVLEPWEVIIKGIVDGFLIGGGLLFLFSLYSALGSGLGSDSDGSGDVASGIDSGVDSGLDIGDGGEIDAGHDIHDISDSTPAPLLLILATFTLAFGITGEVLYSIALDPLTRVVGVVVIPLLLSKGISLLWKRISKDTEGYPLPNIEVDNEVETITCVDEKGGIVVAETSEVQRIKMPARTRAGTEIPAKTIAYVVEIDKNKTLIVDLWPRPAQKSSQPLLTEK